MAYNKKAVTDMAPAPYTAPTYGWMSPNMTTTSYSLDFSTLYLGNKNPSPSTTPNDPPDFTGPKYTTPVVANIVDKSIFTSPPTQSNPPFIMLRITFLNPFMPYPRTQPQLAGL